MREDERDPVSAGVDRGSPEKVQTGLLRVDKELNLEGQICPHTFIESMLALEEMPTNQVLGNEALKAILGLGKSMAGPLLLFNALNPSFE